RRRSPVMKIPNRKSRFPPICIKRRAASQDAPYSRVSHPTSSADAPGVHLHAKKRRDLWVKPGGGGERNCKGSSQPPGVCAAGTRLAPLPRRAITPHDRGNERNQREDRQASEQLGRDGSLQIEIEMAACLPGGHASPVDALLRHDGRVQASPKE